MKARVLAIDDEMKWLENYKAWIPTQLAEQDSAATTLEAVALLRKRRYDVVLLDLSMQTNSKFDRSNRGIQEYLAAKPEGTQYIIVSGVMENEAREVRDAALSLKAFDILFKLLDVDETLIKDRVSAALEASKTREAEFIQEARLKLTDSARLDHELFTTLNLGASDLYRTLDNLLRRLVPIVPHVDRPLFAIGDQQVFALVWSRQLGTAVSISLAKAKLPQEDAQEGLASWLGYERRGDQLFAREIKSVHVMAFAEPSISDKYFELPQIHV